MTTFEITNKGVLLHYDYVSAYPEGIEKKEKEMTTKAASKTETTKPADGNYQAPSALTPPKGFEDGSNPDIDGWYKPRVGEVCQGQIKGHIIMVSKNKQRDVVLVTLAAPLLAALEGEETIMLEVGQTIGVTVTHDLKKMLMYVEKQGEIWITPTEKKDLKGGNSLWKFKQFYKGEKAALRGAAQDDDDIPF